MHLKTLISIYFYLLLIAAERAELQRKSHLSLKRSMKLFDCTESDYSLHFTEPEHQIIKAGVQEEKIKKVKDKQEEVEEIKDDNKNKVIEQEKKEKSTKDKEEVKNKNQEKKKKETKREKEKEKGEEEDRRTLAFSIKFFGLLRSSDTLNLPGPQIIKSNLDEISTKVKFINYGTGNYTFEFYSKEEEFAYLERYEVGELKKINNETIQTVRGQYAEKIVRNNGGCYIRTVGYTADEKGYQPFLLDISKVETRYSVVYAIANLVGEPKGPKILISSTVIATLTGGNLG